MQYSVRDNTPDMIHAAPASQCHEEVFVKLLSPDIKARKKTAPMSHHVNLGRIPVQVTIYLVGFGFGRDGHLD